MTPGSSPLTAQTNAPPRALTIAGSDSSGGAGIQADLKTFTALEVYGMSAVTSVTAQDTRAVHEVVDLPAAIVACQIDAVAEDIGVDAAKTGLLATLELVNAVVGSIERNRIPNLVVDPVMVAGTGRALMDDGAIEAVTKKLLPLARIVTPNLTEAERLSGLPIHDDSTLREAAERILRLGAQAVLITGGHRDAPDATDFLLEGAEWTLFRGPRIQTQSTHGTGCTLSAAIAAHLAHGRSLSESVERAKRYLSASLAAGFDLGEGPGPLNHFWNVLGTD